MSPTVRNYKCKRPSSVRVSVRLTSERFSEYILLVNVLNLLFRNFYFVPYQENKSNNNTEKVLSLTAEAYCDANNLSENRVIKENTSNATENTGQEYNQTIKDFARQKEHLPENDGTIQLHQVLKDEHNLPINKNDKSLTSIDESTLVKFRNNFFEVTVYDVKFEACHTINEEGKQLMSTECMSILSHGCITE